MTDNITKLLLQLGIRSTYYGFRYLRYALELCLKDERYLTSVYKTLYSELSLIHISPRTRAGIRHAAAPAPRSRFLRIPARGV